MCGKPFPVARSATDVSLVCVGRGGGLSALVGGLRVRRSVAAYLRVDVCMWTGGSSRFFRSFLYLIVHMALLAAPYSLFFLEDD